MAASTTSGQFTEEGSTKFNSMFYKQFSAGDEVTVSPSTMTAVTVIDYMGYVEPGAMLTDLSVDGETVAGFDMTKNDYTVEIAPDAVAAPEVTATAMIDGSDVEITNPTTFPGKATIKVTCGDEENVYTITYSAGELISNASRAVGKNFHAAEDDGVGSQLFSDRTSPTYVGGSAANGIAYYNDIRAISDEWNYLTGTDYFMSAVGAGSRPVTFTLNRAAVVRVFSDGTNAVPGWDKITLSDGYYMAASTTSGQFTEEGSTKFNSMFYKQFNAGDEVTVSPTTMTAVTVIDYADYGEEIEEPVEIAALTDISIDGVSIAGFDMDTTDYAYEIAPDTVVAPEITATALVEGSEIEIINPGEGDNPNVFPGKSIVIVRIGDDEREYTIDYTYTALSAITDMSSSNGGSFFASNFHEPGDFGETYGSKLFYDRSSPMTSGSTINYYNDIREIADAFDYLKGTDYIMANRNQGANITHTFTLLRPATVRVFHLTGYASGNATLADWTTETSTEGFAKLSHTLGAGVEGHASYTDPMQLGSMTYKEFEAGEEVSVASPGDQAIVVIDYAGYEIN